MDQSSQREETVELNVDVLHSDIRTVCMFENSLKPML